MNKTAALMASFMVEELTDENGRLLHYNPGMHLYALVETTTEWRIYRYSVEGFEEEWLPRGTMSSTTNPIDSFLSKLDKKWSLVQSIEDTYEGVHMLLLVVGK